MKKIEEISFIINNQKCSYKLHEYQEIAVRKIKKPVEIGEITLQMGYKYEDIKVKITKYALYQEFETNKEIQERLICETESYATILTIIKGILSEQIETINKLQTPTI